MSVLLLLARLLLAAVLGVAGLAKLADRTGSSRALVNFGVPAGLSGPLGILLPVTELVLAVALLPSATARWAAAAAVGLLLLFIVGIAYNLARGRTPDCHCFGQLHSAPAGWPTLARNAVLAAVGGLVAWQGPGSSAIGWIGALDGLSALALAFGVLVVGLLALEGWVLLHLLKQNGRLLLRIEALEARTTTTNTAPAPRQPGSGLPVGTPAPLFRLAGLDGEVLTLDALRAQGKDVMLIFSDPGCGPCNELLPDIARWQREHAATLTIALISRGSPEANRAKRAEHGLSHILLQDDYEIAQAYQVIGTPTAALVRRDGTIGSALASGAEAITALVARTVREPALNGQRGGDVELPANSRIGSPAPEVRLPDLNGNMIDLAKFRGHQTLVLFWNPNCGFCVKMLDALKSWEARPSQNNPKLLVVSTGTVEENKAMGLRSPVVLDQEFKVGRAFGAAGTPSAVLVDAQGAIASTLAIGAPAVMALASGQDQIQLMAH